jgi:hypothetical protein
MYEFEVDLPGQVTKDYISYSWAWVKNRDNWHSLATGILVIICIGLLITLSVLIPLYVQARRGPSLEIPIQDSGVLKVREYKLTLYFLNDWAPRMSGVSNWISLINSTSSFLSIDINDIDTMYFNKTKVNTYNCDADANYYVIDALSPVDYEQALEIVAENSDESKVKDYHFWPSDLLFPTSTQIVSTEFSDCNSAKYRKLSRVYFQEPKVFNYCVALVVSYPWSLTIPNDDLLLYTSNEPKYYWWQGTFTGTLKGGTVRYEMIFEVGYNEQKFLNHDSHPEDGTWTYRIYNLDHGYSDDFDEEVDADAFNIWQQLADINGRSCIE